jgi:hypothetical protein
MLLGSLWLLSILCLSCNPDSDFSPPINPADQFDCPVTLQENDRYVPVNWNQAPAKYVLEGNRIYERSN